MRKKQKKKAGGQLFSQSKLLSAGFKRPRLDDNGEVEEAEEEAEERGLSMAP